MIKPGAATMLPAKVGDWTQNTGSSGPATIYADNGALISVGFLSGSDYNGIVKNITRQKTRAGTGYCGSTSDATNLTCYLKAADGVFNISADAGDAPLPKVVDFANQITADLGTG